MSRRAPQVVEGLRTPSETGPAVLQNLPAASQLDASIRALEQDPARARGAAEGEYVFESRYSQLMIQITAPSDKYDVATGILVRANPVVAKFNLGEYRTRDPYIVQRIKESKSWASGDVWSAEDRAREIAEASKTALVDILKKHPDLVQSVVHELRPTGKSDFDLPAEGVQPSA